MSAQPFLRLTLTLDDETKRVSSFTETRAPGLSPGFSLLALEYAIASALKNNPPTDEDRADLELALAVGAVMFGGDQ